MNKLPLNKRTAIVVVLVGLALVVAIVYVFFGRGTSVQNDGSIGGEPVDPSKVEIEDGYSNLKNNPPGDDGSDEEKTEHYESLRYSASRLNDCKTIEDVYTEMQEFAPKEKVITTQLWAASCYLQDGDQKDVAKANQLFNLAETEIDSVPAGDSKENLTTQLNLRRPI